MLHGVFACLPHRALRTDPDLPIVYMSSHFAWRCLAAVRPP